MIKKLDTPSERKLHKGLICGITCWGCWSRTTCAVKFNLVLNRMQRKRGQFAPSRSEDGNMDGSAAVGQESGIVPQASNEAMSVSLQLIFFPCHFGLTDLQLRWNPQLSALWHWRKHDPDDEEGT